MNITRTVGQGSRKPTFILEQQVIPDFCDYRARSADLHRRIVLCVEKHGLSTVMLRRGVDEVGQEVHEVFDGELGSIPPFFVRLFRYVFGDGKALGHRSGVLNGRLSQNVLPGVEDGHVTSIAEAEQAKQNGMPQLTINERVQMCGFVPISPVDHINSPFQQRLKARIAARRGDSGKGKK